MSIDGWRGGVILARLARSAAGEGDARRARELARMALSRLAQGTQWAGRVRLLVAETFALLGDTEKTLKLARDIPGTERAEGAHATAVIALAHAATRDYAGALAGLDALANDGDYLAAWWRAMGFLWLAELPEVVGSNREDFLAGAIDAADAVPGWKRAALLGRRASSAGALGRPAMARPALGRAGAAVK